MGGGDLSSGLPLRLSPSRGSHPHWPQSTAPPDGLRGAAHAACVATLDSALLVLSKSPNGRGSAGAGAPQPGLWTGHLTLRSSAGPCVSSRPSRCLCPEHAPPRTVPHTCCWVGWGPADRPSGREGGRSPRPSGPRCLCCLPVGSCVLQIPIVTVSSSRPGSHVRASVSARVWEPSPPASPHTKAATWAQGGRAVLQVAAMLPLGPGPAAGCAGAGREPAPPSLHPLLPLTRHPTR